MLLALSLPSLALAAPAWADLPPMQAEPQALLDAAAERVGDQALEILFEDVRIVFGEDRTVAREQHMVYLLRDPSAAPYWTRVDASWAPWFQARPSMEARVVRPDGKTFTLDASTIVEEAARDSDATLLDDRRVAYAPLPQLTAGSVVEIVITDRPTGAFGPGGASARELVATGETAWPKRVTVEAPAKMPLRWSAVELETEPKTTTKGGVRRLVFDLEPILEPYARPDWSAPQLPATPYLQLSTGSSWEAESAAYHALVADKLAGKELGPLLAAAEGKTGIDRVEALLNAVRARVRYTGIEFGEAAIVPATPDAVLARGWGDCKEQAALLVALLTASGIPAEIALIRPGAGEDAHPDHPTLAAFSHAIVHVPGPPELWIDPSVPQLGARETPMEELGHHALLVRPKGGALVKIPMPAPEANRLSTTTEIRLTPGQPTPLTVSVTGNGAVLLPFRPPWGKDPIAHFREQFEQEGGAKYPDVTHRGVARTDEPFQIDARGTSGERPFFEEWSQAIGLRQNLLLPGDITRGQIDEERTEPYVVLPNRMEETYRVRVPEGYVLADVPEALTFEHGPLRIELTRAREGDLEVVRMTSTVSRADLPVAEARALADALATLNAGFTGKMRVVAESVKLVEDEKPAEGVKRARELIAAHPDDPAGYVNLSSVFYRGGFRDLAVAELERAAKLRPKDAWILGRRAVILFTDPIARPGSPPFDATTARAAAKACLDADATIEPCRNTYGMSLTVDTTGRFLAEGAPLAELETWASALPEDDRNATLEELRVHALIGQGRFADAKKLAVKQGLMRWAVVATALGESPTAAAAAVTRMNEWGRWNNGKAAVDELERLRRYPEAHAVAKAAVGKGTEPDRVALVERLAASRRWEDRATEVGGAGAAALRFLRAVGGGAPKAELAALASPELLTWLDADPQRDDWWSTLRPVVASWIGTATPDPEAVDRGLDEILAVGTFTVEGDEKTGWKVTLRGKEWRRPLRLLVAKGKKGPEVRAVTILDHTVAGEAMRRVKANDIAGAAWWIDAWQSDEPAGDDAALAARYRTAGDVDPAHVRVAAAMLAWPSDAAALDVLRDAYATETGDKRLLVGRRLSGALIATKKWDELGPVLDTLLAAHPNESKLVLAKVELEAAEGRWDAAAAVLDAAIAAHPRDIWLRTTAVEVAQERGDAGPAVAALLAALDNGDITARELNEAAWTLVFVPGQEAKALALVERAIEMKGVGDGTRHTLAMAQLGAGKVSKAVETLREEVKRSGDVRNLPDYWWLVRGGIAEAYGLNDEAIAAYRRVPVEGGARRFKSVIWAEARIAALGGTTGATK